MKNFIDGDESAFNFLAGSLSAKLLILFLTNLS